MIIPQELQLKMGCHTSKSHSSEGTTLKAINYSIDCELSNLPQAFKMSVNDLKVRRRGYNEDHTPFFNFMKENKSSLIWQHGDCIVSGSKRFRPEFRLVNECQSKFEIMSSQLETFLFINDVDIDENIELLKYDTGCFSAPHVDKNATYTCLIFPSSSSHVGGDLVFHLKNNQCKSFKTSDLKTDTMVIFPVDTVHEVLPVIRGERYVFKIRMFT